MLQALIVTLRERLELAFIVGITLVYLAKIGRSNLRKPVYAAPARLVGAGPNGDGKRVEMEMPPLHVALVDLELGEAGTIDHISLPPADQQFLMRVGFVPGVQIRFSRRAPLGDPSVYSVDGTEVALRAETACHIIVQREGASPLGDLL